MRGPSYRTAQWGGANEVSRCTPRRRDKSERAAKDDAKANSKIEGTPTFPYAQVTTWEWGY